MIVRLHRQKRKKKNQAEQLFPTDAIILSPRQFRRRIKWSFRSYLLRFYISSFSRTASRIVTFSCRDQRSEARRFQGKGRFEISKMMQDKKRIQFMEDLTSYTWRILYLELSISSYIYHNSTRQVFSICYTGAISEKVLCSWIARTWGDKIWIHIWVQNQPFHSLGWQGRGKQINNKVNDLTVLRF